MSATIRRSHFGTLITAAAAAALVPALLAAPAQAAPPANDDIAHAMLVTTTPGTWTTDTTEATSDPTDGRHVGGHSVWFRFRSDHTGRFALTTAGSTFNSQLAVFAGPRDDRRLVDWDRNGGPGLSAADRMRIRDGVTYWIAVSSQGTDGGTAHLTIGRLGTPAVELTDVEGASGGVSGELVVTADLTCTRYAMLYGYVRASQRVGDNVALGYWELGEVQCGPDAPTTVTFVFDSQTGWAFQPGEAVLRGEMGVWNGITWTNTELAPITFPVVDAPLARTRP